MSNSLFTMIDGTEITVSNIRDHFDYPTPEEKEGQGRHFKGDVTFEFDLTKDERLKEEDRGMYYVGGFWDGDWGVDSDSMYLCDFLSNDKIAAKKLKAGTTITISATDFENEADIAEVKEKLQQGINQFLESTSSFLVQKPCKITVK